MMKLLNIDTYHESLARLLTSLTCLQRNAAVEKLPWMYALDSDLECVALTRKVLERPKRIYLNRLSSLAKTLENK
jgi:hypothetical protein